ncbi:hypothetical protein [Pseudomonas orientalis]|uniref:Uncharacterized protein n=1 Tax=Pseudomonas orientalis TaxID=76758 RepID=A0A4Q7CXA0_9PSED|nr:hypothetical protein [Pseudomonas orientalis]RZI31024.1 hypothetical protein EUX57_14280 [Pseudomonas orientalis]
MKTITQRMRFGVRSEVVAPPLSPPVVDPELIISRAAYASNPEKVISSVKRFHDENFQQVSKALDLAEKQLRKCIAKPAKKDPAEDLANEITCTRLYTLILGVWCEARLHKLLYETSAFSEAERFVVYNTKSIEQRWQAALDIGIKRHASLASTAEISGDTLGFLRFKIYEEIRNWINLYLSPAMTLRNKIAHTQWVKTFGNMQGEWINSSDFSINQSSMDLLRCENLLTTKLKFELIKEVSITINNLAVDNARFQAADFDERHKVVSAVVLKLKSANYLEYRAGIVDKFGS